MPLNHYSIDIETLGIQGDAAIISIGACRFDISTGQVDKTDTYYKELNLEDSLKYGSVSAQTLAWWMDQSHLARSPFRGIDSKTYLKNALDIFSSWILTGRDRGDLYVWGNGATFDISILENAFVKTGRKSSIPWAFRNIRDTRTIVDVAGKIFGFKIAEIPTVGTKHNALDDAIFQAEVICAAYGLLAGTRKGVAK